MIEFVTGDFFDYKADIRINTVNCVGVMGAGVALEFKNRYPDMFKAYVEVCKRKEISPGRPYIWEDINLFSRCIIINLPTKVHWRNPSKYEYIESDLVWLKKYLLTVSEESVVTLPALGCGHGGLDWEIVKNMIDYYLQEISAKILVFEPSASNKKFENVHYQHMLQKEDIKVLFSSDKYYPSNLQNSYGKEIYCKGNIELLVKPKIGLICGNYISERQNAAIYKVLDELEKDKYVFIFALNNKKSEERAVTLLTKGYKLILVLPYGIMNFSNQLVTPDFKDNVMIISYLKPKQEFRKYEYINSLKFRIAISNAILYCDDDRENIKKMIKYLKGCKNIFYINYWDKSINEFIEINAYKIGLNSKTQKPNLLLLKEQLKEG